MPFHIADLILVTLNYVTNIAYLHRYINLKNVDKYKNPDNAQIIIIFLQNIVLTVYQINCFFSLFIVIKLNF